MKIYCLFLLLIAFCLCQDSNQQYPGIVASLGISFLNKVKDNYFTRMMEDINNLQIEDSNEGKLRMHSMKMNIEIPSSENLQIFFDTQNDGLRFTISNLKAEVSGRWVFKKSFVKIKGHFNLRGIFDLVGVTFGFTTQEKDGYQIPAVYTKAVNIETDKHKWKGSFGNNAIEKVGNSIMKAFRNKGVKSIKKKLTDKLQNKVPTTINRGIKNSIQVEAPLESWIYMNIATVSPIKVNPDSLSVPLNGTVYIPGSNVNTKHKATEVMLNMSNSQNDVLVTASNYVFDTFTESLNQYDFDYSLNSNGYSINVFIPGNNNSISIKNTDKGLHFIAQGTCLMLQSRTSFDIKISGDLTFNFTKGDEQNMFYLHPIINKDSLDISTSNAHLVGQSLGLGILSPIFGPILEHFSLKLNPKPIPVKKIKDFPFTLSASSTEYTEAHMFARLDF
ncbi:unnamed protein product [Moneuplotes crassus]|uniref:Uncharacterized protein n=1 Tax=Euplotes crassus TaxID=5936 RepID=A0AAD1ULP2_EUPCR|nr:unnamed protein product [Moneuplotes crassus]